MFLTSRRCTWCLLGLFCLLFTWYLLQPGMKGCWLPCWHRPRYCTLNTDFPSSKLPQQPSLDMDIGQLLQGHLAPRYCITIYVSPDPPPSVPRFTWCWGVSKRLWGSPSPRERWTWPTSIGSTRCPSPGPETPLLSVHSVGAFQPPGHPWGAQHSSSKLLPSADLPHGAPRGAPSGPLGPLLPPPFL